jgi:hypothetical protein
MGLKKLEDINKYRLGLIGLYEEQLQETGPFMTLVLSEAIRKLKEYPIELSNSETLGEILTKWNKFEKDLRKVEDWVVDLEKLWGKILFK